MRWAVILTIPLFILVGCSEKQDKGKSRPRLSERQRDSTLAESKLPGAKAVGKAMTVADSASARAARLDSKTH